MSGDLDVLPLDVRAMLRAERSCVSVPDDARTRLAERLAAAVPGFGPPLLPATTVALSHGAWTTTAAKVLVAMALGGGALATYEANHPSVPPHATPVAVQERAPQAKPVVVEPPDVVPPPISAPEVASARSSPARASIANLRQEQRLLDAARDSIVRGEPEGALVPLASHAARFPRGSLAEERDALRIRALARLGRLDEARESFTRFRAAYPHSFLLDGAAADVEPIP